MSVFYFDITDGRGHHRDEFGEQFESLNDAIAQARALLPDLFRDERSNDDWHGTTCDLRDHAGTVVYRCELTFRGRQLPA